MAYISFLPKNMNKLSRVASICWSPIIHPCQRITRSIYMQLDICERCVVQLPIFKSTFTTEWIARRFFIIINNDSWSMRESFIESTDLKSNFNLRDLCIFWIIFIGRNHFILKILLKLPVTLLETFEVIEERIHRI